MRFLTPVEIARLADAIRPRYRALVLVGAYGGLHIGELAGLRRERVELLRGTVEVAEIMTEVAGKLQVGPPKTRASRRTIGLPRAVVNVLAEHLARVVGQQTSCSPAHRAIPCESQTSAIASGARYAEFAGWLHQDAGNPQEAAYWSDRVMGWAQAAGNDLMVSYVLMRKSNQASSQGDASRTLGLARAAPRGQDWLSPRRSGAGATSRGTRPRPVRRSDRMRPSP
jgi:hypothetical protein